MRDKHDDVTPAIAPIALALAAAGCQPDNSIEKQPTVLPQGKVPKQASHPEAAKPNDRVSEVAPEGDVPDPKVFFVVDGKKFGRPSLETYYAKTQQKQPGDQTTVCSCNVVTGTYCSCNKVCTCNLVCTCQSVCSCVGYTPRRTGGTYCSCNKVCTCVPVH